eukprot:2174572-Alexandrium_andersonii.AAC.1
MCIRDRGDSDRLHGRAPRLNRPLNGDDHVARGMPRGGAAAGARADNPEPRGARQWSSRSLACSGN